MLRMFTILCQWLKGIAKKGKIDTESERERKKKRKKERKKDSHLKLPPFKARQGLKNINFYTHLWTTARPIPKINSDTLTGKKSPLYYIRKENSHDHDNLKANEKTLGV